MSEPEIRLACLQLALSATQGDRVSKEQLADLAEYFFRFATGIAR